MPHAAVSERQRGRAKQLRQGFQVLRFTNEQVMSNLEGVVDVIRQAASSRANSSPPSLTLPHKGGGNGEDRADLVENISNTRGQP